MKVLVINPIMYTSETKNIKRAASIKDTMMYDFCLAFHEMGHSVTLVGGEPFKPTKSETYPFEVLWWECKCQKVCMPHCLPFMPETYWYVKQHRTEYDLIITSEVFSLNSLMAYRAAPDKTIIWHELAKHNAIMKKIPSKIWYGVIARLFMRNAKVVARSVEARNFVKKYCMNTDVNVIDHGVNLDKFKASTEKDNSFVVCSQLIERKKIDGILEKMPEELSAADTYRVLLGRALMRRPGILLLDRTIAEADPDVQELMRKEFANINRELGITVIYATDNQKTAMALGTRMIVMNEGEICQEDSAQNIYDHPESLFVAGFFGTPRMDLSIAKVLEENGNIILKFASGKIRLSGEKAELLKKLGYVGKEVFTGVRPEKIVPAEDGKGEITGDILGSEEIEDATYIRFHVGENEFLAKASDGEKPSVKKMSFAVSGDDVYLFDKETEKIIAE